jgi:hypothetical protein
MLQPGIMMAVYITAAQQPLDLARDAPSDDGNGGSVTAAHCNDNASLQ